MTSSPLRNGFETPPSQHPRTSRRSRPSPRGRHGSSPAGPLNSSPGRWDSLDSPSRQLIEEFTRVIIDSDRCFKEKLDRVNAEQEKLHQEALEIAARKHANVLQCAELAREALRRQVELAEAERRRREEEKVEQARQEEAAKAAAERKKRLEQAQAAEKERRDAEQQARAIAEAEARTKAENDRRVAEAKQNQEHAAQQKREADARAKAEQDQKAQQAQMALEAARNAAAVKAATPAIASGSAPPAPSATPSAPVVTPNAEVEADHKAYLQLHKKLKEMRQYMKTQHRQCMEAKKNTGIANPAIEEMSDMRREMTKLVGQLTGDNKKNLVIRTNLKTILEKAGSMSAVTLDAREFIIKPTNPWTEGINTQVPGVYVYLLNLLVKLSIKTMPTSASNKAYNAVDPIGIIACWAFSLSNFHIQGNSFVDILLAKYHFVCPPLFGIYGSEKTQQGRTRLGWARESGEGAWLSPHLHYDRLAGVSVGWAALTLRDFSKSQNRNPLPAWYYWRSLAFILNVPPAQITSSHGIILKGLIELYAKSFYKFYGPVAIVALRTAVVDLPAATAAQNNTALQGVAVLRETLKAKYDLAL